MKVQFTKNDDGLTSTMLVDGKLRKDSNRDIPYVPAKDADHRGLNLYLLLQELNLTIEDLDIQADEDLQGILSGVEYMDYPYHVIEAVQTRENYKR